jgi:hypothetical protein
VIAGKRLRRAALAQGWRVEMGGNGHWKFTPPDRRKRIVIASNSPSDRQAERAVLRDLQRSGFHLLQRNKKETQ